MTCEHCAYVAKFHSYVPRRLVTAHGAVWMQRAYYYCGRCRRGFLPYDEALGLTDEVSPGLMPLVCLAGTLLPFADAAQDLLQRFAGVRLSASTVLRDTEGEGERLRAQQKAGRMVEPTQAVPCWTAAREGGHPAAYVGLDALAITDARHRGGQNRAPHRLHAPAHTPGKEHTRYLVDFELDALAEQVPGSQARRWASPGSATIAITDGGNGLEEALRRSREPSDDPGLVSRRRAPVRLCQSLAQAGCKIIGERLKGSGMRLGGGRRRHGGLVTRLYVSGGKVWDGFWAQPRRRAA